MDDLAVWLAQQQLPECAPYLTGLNLTQVLALTSMPADLVDEKPKLAKKLKQAIKTQRKATKKPTTSGKEKGTSTIAAPVKVPAQVVEPIVARAVEVEPEQHETLEPLPPLPGDKDPTPEDFENLLRMCRESNKKIAESWRVAFQLGPRSVDDEEFVITTDLVSSTLACLASTPVAATPDFKLFYSKLRQFAELQQEYESNMARPEQLKAIQTSRSKRRKVSRLNSRIHMEIKWVLEASGIANSECESLAIRKRSLGRITVKEGQALWEAHFHDLDMDMVLWDRFIGAFMMHTKQTIDMHDEILLKHILDNDNLGTVTPKQFSSFLKCFGPLDKALENVKHLYKQKWFHDFLSVEEVHRLLTDQPPGTFLVRFSRSHSNSFALEYVSGKVLTVLIRNDMPNGVFIKEENNVEKMFPNLEHLIRHYGDILKIPFQSDLVIQPWFVGDVSTADAEEMLQHCPPGTFMIRFAASGRFQYACSYVSSSGVIKHTMIQKVPNGYVIEETRSGLTPTGQVVSEAAASSSGIANGSSSSNTTTTTPTVYPSLVAFLKVWKSELKYNYDVENVPNMPVAEFMETDRFVNLCGPGDCDGNGGFAEFNSRVYAQTVASYPKACLGWTVVCDQWYVRLLGNRIVFALADGCSWGSAPREAARRACQAIIDQVGDHDVQARIHDTLEARHYLLRSFSVAHEQILAASTGTTTLLAGILLEVDPDNDEWAMVAASVGDCKAFVYMSEQDRCVDVTLGNRRNLRDARDPGGRLGATDSSNLPDLRNLASYFWPMKRNDILMIVSDGVHDNLDPESFGKQPKDLAPDFTDPRLQALASGVTDWDAADQDTTEKLKSMWMLQKLNSLVSKSKDKSVKSISTTLIDHALSTTLPSRSFMEANPDKPEPADHIQFPGKMDHTTCISFVVGSPFFKDLMSWRNRSGRSVSTNTSTLRLSGGAAGSAVATGVAAVRSKVVTEDVKSEARSTAKHQQQQSTTKSSQPSRPMSPNTAASSTHASSSSPSLVHANKPTNLTALTVLPSLFQPDASLSGHAPTPFTPPSTICTTRMQNVYSKLPAITLNPVSTEYSFQIGNASPGDCNLHCASIASGRSLSTYPVDTASLTANSAAKKRIGDPNTAHFCVDATPTRILFAVSTGTTWGASSASSSYKASHAFFHSIRESNSEITDSKEAALAGVTAFDEVQTQILNDPNTVAQSTVVLLAGILASVPQEKRWMSIFVTLGNNKAFVWKHATRTIIDLTNPKDGADRRRPGGFLSTDARHDAPVLSNLCVSMSDLEADDIVLVMTPGVYFNFDPELLGLSPKSDVIQPPLKEDTWSPDAPDHVQARAYYRCRAIEQVLATVEDKDDLPRKFSNVIIDYCKKTTSHAREYMETNPAASEPSDRTQYPGKMGHAMCLAIRANKLTQEEANSFSVANTRQSLLVTQNRPMKA